MSRKRKTPIEQIVEQIEGKVPDSVVHVDHDGKKVTQIRQEIRIRKFPIAIGIPFDEMMFSRFFANFLYLSIMPWDNIITSQSSLLEDARNTIHDAFLDNCKATHLLMLDSDVLPPPDLIDRLLAHKLPVVGGWYRKKESFHVKNLDGVINTIQRPVVYDFDKWDEEKKKFVYRERMKEGVGLEKVDGMGAGCWMIRRDAAEKIGKSPFSFEFGGEDLTFCRALIDAGFDIYVDWSLACAHAGIFWV